MEQPKDTPLEAVRITSLRSHDHSVIDYIFFNSAITYKTLYTIQYEVTTFTLTLMGYNISVYISITTIIRYKPYITHY